MATYIPTYYEALTLPQKQVLAFLAAGVTITKAAELMGIHRNTIAHWRRTSPNFRLGWTDMQYEQSMYWRDEVQAIAHLGVDTLVQLIVNRGGNPNVRLRASVTLVQQMSKPHPRQPDMNRDMLPSVLEDHELQPPADSKNPRNSVQRTVDLSFERTLEPLDPELFTGWQPAEWSPVSEPIPKPKPSKEVM